MYINDVSRPQSEHRVHKPGDWSVRGEESFEVKLPIMLFTWSDFLMTYLPFYLPAVSYFFIGLVVYILKPDTQASWSFFLTCIFFSILNATGSVTTPLILFKIYLLTMSFCAAAVFHLALVFPEKKAFIVKHPFIQYLPYVILVFWGIPTAAIYPKPGFYPFFTPLNIILTISPFCIVASTIWSYFKKTSVIARQRAKIIFLGAEFTQVYAERYGSPIVPKPKKHQQKAV